MKLSSKAWLVAAAVAVVVVFLLFREVFWGVEAPQNTEETSSVAHSTKEWVKHLQDPGSELILRKEVPGPTGVHRELGKIQGLGTLTAEETASFRATLEDLQKVHLKEYQKDQAASEKNAQVALHWKFAKSLVHKEEAAAAIRSFSEGSYYVEKEQTSVPMVDGVRLVSSSIMRGKQQLYVTVVIELDKFPDLATAVKYRDDTYQFLLQERTQEFNSGEYGWRKAMVGSYSDTVRQGKPLSAALQKFFMNGIIVDDQQYLLNIAPSK